MSKLTPLGLAQSNSTIGAVATNYDIISGIPHAGSVETVVLLGDPVTGRVLGQPQCMVETVSYVLSDYGRAEISGSATDSILRQARIGQRVAISFSNGLPMWGGVIDEPIVQRQGQIRLSCFGPNHLLKSRTTGVNEVVESLSPGVAIQRLFVAANEIQPLPIEVVVEEDNDTELVSFVAHLSQIYPLVQQIATNRVEYVTETLVTGGRISFRLIIRRRVGVDRSKRVVLSDGLNLGTNNISTQGPLRNHWQVAGKGDLWVSDGSTKTVREVVESIDEVSMAIYGLRQDSKVIDSTDSDVLEQTATQNLSSTVRPTVTFQAQVVDAPPARFGQYSLGDFLRVELFPWDGIPEIHVKRVLGRTYETVSGLSELVLGNTVEESNG